MHKIYFDTNFAEWCIARHAMFAEQARNKRDQGKPINARYYAREARRNLANYYAEKAKWRDKFNKT